MRVVLWWPTREKNSFKKSTNVSLCLIAFTKFVFQQSKLPILMVIILSFVKKVAQ